MSNRHARELKTHDINEVFVKDLQNRESALRANHVWLAPALDQFCNGRAITPPRNAPAGLTLLERAVLIDEASYVGIYRMWARRGRVTFDLNEHMASELYRSSYDKLPGSIFDRLPYINPLVVLPDPWPVRFGKSEGLVRGFFIHGFNQIPERQTYTDEDIEGLGLLFVIDLLDEETGDVNYQTYVRLNLPTCLAEFTLSQAVEFAAARAEARWIRSPDKGAVYDMFESMLKPALSILVYLCCDNRDVAEPPVIKPTHKKRAKASLRDRDPFFVEVGWRVGPALHAARRQAGRILDGEGIPSGFQQAPHQRSGHFKKVRVGRGGADRVTRFVMPYWVRLDLLAEHEDPITTVVPVDPQRHDALRRRGLRNARASGGRDPYADPSR
ncbi:hypothetical protein ACFWY6_42745 [Streptomyces sp. NPDC059037]|uniref:hypothetical protein n=1 Tax=Streptomyces sp. NPDC059037 TaxID=3346710 RepID=UPI00369B3E70